MKKTLVAVLALLGTQTTYALCQNEAAAVESAAQAFGDRISQYCETLTYGGSDKVAVVLCDNKTKFSISYKNDEVFALIFSQTKNNFMHQCFIDGSIDSSCKANLKPMTCETIDLR